MGHLRRKRKLLLRNVNILNTPKILSWVSNNLKDYSLQQRINCKRKINEIN